MIPPPSWSFTSTIHKVVRLVCGIQPLVQTKLQKTVASSLQRIRFTLARSRSHRFQTPTYGRQREGQRQAGQAKETRILWRDGQWTNRIVALHWSISFVFGIWKNASKSPPDRVEWSPSNLPTSKNASTQLSPFVWSGWTCWMQKSHQFTSLPLTISTNWTPLLDASWEQRSDDACEIEGRTHGKRGTFRGKSGNLHASNPWNLRKAMFS